MNTAFLENNDRDVQNIETTNALFWIAFLYIDIELSTFQTKLQSLVKVNTSFLSIHVFVLFSVAQTT
jgi:hypothetical protein